MIEQNLLNETAKPMRSMLGAIEDKIVDDNNRARNHMKTENDMGYLPRTVRHYAKRENESDMERDELRKLLVDNFSVEPVLYSGTNISMTHETEIASSCFDKFTKDLAVFLLSYGWDYVAWDCEAVEHPSFQ